MKYPSGCIQSALNHSGTSRRYAPLSLHKVAYIRKIAAAGSAAGTKGDGVGENGTRTSAPTIFRSARLTRGLAMCDTDHTPSPRRDTQLSAAAAGNDDDDDDDDGRRGGSRSHRREGCYVAISMCTRPVLRARAQHGAARFHFHEMMWSTLRGRLQSPGCQGLAVKDARTRAHSRCFLPMTRERHRAPRAHHAAGLPRLVLRHHRRREIAG